MTAEIDSETLASLLQQDGVSQSSNHSPIDGAFAPSQTMPTQHHHQLPPQHMGSQPFYPPPQNFQPGYDYHYPQQQLQMPQLSMEQEVRRPRVSTGQTNERELKEMLDKNDHRTLEEVAEEVIATERTSSSEKSKQLFAMLWYVGFACSQT
jgi:regulatory factor X